MSIIRSQSNDGRVSLGQEVHGLIATSHWRRWSVGYVLVQLPTTMTFVAFVISGQHITGSMGSGVRLAAITTVLSGLSAPLTSRAMDRNGVALGIRISCVVSAVVLLAIAVMGAASGGIVAVIALAAAYGVASSSIAGGYRALLPRVVLQHQVPSASALEPALTQLAFVIGPALAGLSAAVAGALSPLALMSTCLLLSGVLTYGISHHDRHERGVENKVRKVWRRLSARVSYGLTVCVAVAAGLTQAALPSRLAEAGLRTELVGVLLAVQAVGAAIASVVMGRRIFLSRYPFRYVIGLLWMAGITAVGLVHASSSITLALVMMVLGIPLGLLYAINMMLLQASVPRHQQAEGFATLLALSALGVGLGQAAGGSLIEIASSYVALLCGGGAFVLATLLPYHASRRNVLLRPIWTQNR